MPRGGTGIYVLPALNPVVTNTIITSTWGNNTLSDVATALTQSVATTGVSAISANLPMTGFRHTSVGAAATFDQYARADQVQESTFQLLSGVASSGAVNTAYTANLLLGQPASRAFALNQFVIFIPNTDAIGIPTLAVNGSTPVAIASYAGGVVADSLRASSPVTLTWTGSTWAIIGASSSTIPYNYIINGGTIVKQRAPATLSTTLQYGSVDRFKVRVFPGSVSAGIITSTQAAPIGRSGFALHLSGVSLGVASELLTYTFIESQDAVNLKNSTISCSVLVYQDAVASATCEIRISKATSIDNFNTVTNLAFGGGAVLQSTPTLIKVENVAMGDCTNGIQVRVAYINPSFPAGITNKNFYFTEFQLSEGSSAPPFTRTPISTEYPKCLRYFQKSFQYGISPAGGVSSPGSIGYTCVRAGVNDQLVVANQNVTMRVEPAVTFYNPFLLDAKWGNVDSGSASGVASIFTNGGCGPIIFKNPQVAGDAIGHKIFVHYTFDSDF